MTKSSSTHSRRRVGLAVHIARKDWKESRRIIALLTTGLLAPALVTRTGATGSEDLATGLLAGLLAGTSFGYAQYCFLNERLRGTLETLLGLPVQPWELVLAKYLSVYSMVLFTVNVPAMFLTDWQLVYVSNAAALLLATVFMAATVVSEKPWAFQIPVWGLLLFVMPVERLLERYYPAGLAPFRALSIHPFRLASGALALAAVIATVSVLVFSWNARRDQ